MDVSSHGSVRWPSMGTYVDRHQDGILGKMEGRRDGVRSPIFVYELSSSFPFLLISYFHGGSRDFHFLSMLRGDEEVMMRDGHEEERRSYPVVER